MSNTSERSISYVLTKPVSTYMDTNVLILDRYTLTRDATRIMKEKNKDCVVVIDHKKIPIGLVTSKDVLDKVSDVRVTAETTALRDIMSSPLVTVKDRATLQVALHTMRDQQIKELPVMTKHGRLVGIISQERISEIVRKATSTSTRTLSPPLRAILGNLGFVLQFAGVLLLVPAVLATALNDTVTATGIYLSTVFLLVTGFFLNSYGEKASLNMQQASILVFSSMFILILFGTMPYLYLEPYESDSAIELFANSFFSSAAGFTTGGISLFDRPEDLPQSFTFYRSFTQLVGGMSFIYLVMTAFFPVDRMLSMRGFLTGQKLHLRELFGTITLIFMLYIAVMALLLYLLGEQNIIDNISLSMSTIATGGFLPSSTMLHDLPWYVYPVLLGGMILGALPFTLHYSLVRKKTLMPKLGMEVVIYFAILAGSIILFLALSGLDPLHAIFYPISASTTAGLQLESLASLGGDTQVILVLLMFAGGCGFSTAGGIKIFRLMQLKGVVAVAYRLPGVSARTETAGTHMDPKRLKALLVALLVIGLFPLTALVAAEYLVVISNVPFEAAFFEAAALITTGGLSVDVITIETDPATKIIMSFVMIFGRLEIIAILYIFLPKLTT